MCNGLHVRHILMHYWNKQVSRVETSSRAECCEQCGASQGKAAGRGRGGPIPPAATEDATSVCDQEGDALRRPQAPLLPPQRRGEPGAVRALQQHPRAWAQLCHRGEVVGPMDICSLYYSLLPSH